MFRAILFLLFGIVAITLLRGVVGILGKLFSGFAAPPSRPPAPAPEMLKKDPVCGTFVAASTAVHKMKDGQTYYFCSAECRDRF